MRDHTVLVTAAKPQQQLNLVETSPSELIVVNARCVVEEQDGICVVVVSGTPVFQYHRDNHVDRSIFIAQAMAGGYASAAELAAALDVSLSTVYRYKRVFEEGGTSALIPKRPGPAKGQWLGEAERQAIRKWHAEGVTGREIATRLKHAPGTVQKAIRRMGLPPRRPQVQQQSLLGAEANSDDPEPALPVAHEADNAAPALIPSAPISAPPGPVSPSKWGADPFDRSLDRFLASQGLLLDAEPIFAPGTGLPRLGVLLALPLIVGTGLFEESGRLYGSIGPAFYGLRTSLLVVVLMALLRIKHPENLKEYSPPELGRIIGLDRTPEVKTLRGKLRLLAAGPSETLICELAKRRVQARDHALGFLYVDGHVRVYSGKYRLPKGHVTRMRMSLPATEDVWVNDADGDPIFFITQEAHPSLVTAMEAVVEETRELLGDRRLTFVFDRGGWSPKLFKWLVVQRFDVINYRKGKVEPIPEDQFEELDVIGNHGSDKTWLLHDCNVSIGSGADQLQMRQVTRLQNGHQTHIVTTRMDLSASEIAHRMFHRWTQENFFKYMRDEFALDALLEYGAEEEDPLRDVPNPDWRRANSAWRKAKTKLKKLEATHGALLLDGKTSTAELLSALKKERAEVDRCKAARNQHKKRVTIDDLRDEDRTVRLPARRKRLSDGLKMLAYQVESDLVRAVAPHYRRVEDEGRTLIAAALQSAGDIELDDDELRITLAPQSSPHRTRAVAELCHLLDDMAVTFPGTQLRVRYAIRDAPIVTLA